MFCLSYISVFQFLVFWSHQLRDFSFRFFPSCPSCLAKCNLRLRNIFITLSPKVPKTKNQTYVCNSVNKSYCIKYYSNIFISFSFPKGKLRASQVPNMLHQEFKSDLKTILALLWRLARSFITKTTRKARKIAR